MQAGNRRAQEMLELGALRAGRQRPGYDDAAFFRRRFKRSAGLTPVNTGRTFAGSNGAKATPLARRQRRLKAQPARFAPSLLAGSPLPATKAPPRHRRAAIIFFESCWPSGAHRGRNGAIGAILKRGAMAARAGAG